MSVLVASDLDGTLLYSARSAALAAAALTCVERIDGVPAGFMTEVAATGLSRLAERTTFVPVTSRSPGQLSRVALPGSRYAVAANGGLLLVDGVAEPSWSAAVAARLTGAAALDEVWRHVAGACRAQWTAALRNVADLFCYAVVRAESLPSGFVAEESAWAAERGWRVSAQGRKVYWVPRQLTKSAAVAEIARRVEAETVLAAGDSLLDLDLLTGADLGIRPRHGELAAAGWTAPHVTVTAGVGALAGEQIVEWFAAAAADSAAS